MLASKLEEAKQIAGHDASPPGNSKNGSLEMARASRFPAKWSNDCRDGKNGPIEIIRSSSFWLRSYWPDAQGISNDTRKGAGIGAVGGAAAYGGGALSLGAGALIGTTCRAKNRNNTRRINNRFSKINAPSIATIRRFSARVKPSIDQYDW